MEGCISATAKSSPSRGVVHCWGCPPCTPRGWLCCAMGAARQGPRVSPLRRGTSRVNPPGSGLSAGLHAVGPGGTGTVSLPQSSRRWWRQGQGKHACRPVALGSASRGHVGPRCPGWTLSRSTSAPPRVPEAAARRSRDVHQGKCQRWRDAASRDPMALAHCIPPRATLGTPSMAAGRRGVGGGLASTWTFAAPAPPHKPLSARVGQGLQRERASSASNTPRHASELPGRSRSRGSPFHQWLCFVP